METTLIHTMTAKDILIQVCTALPDQFNISQFADTFLSFVGMASFDVIDEDSYPELNTLFDLCVQYQDRSAAARRREIALSISTLVTTTSDNVIKIKYLT